MKKLIFAIWLLLTTSVMAEGFGSSTEGDSAIATISLNNARDSAWVLFAFGESDFYDTVSASPISGTSNTNLESNKFDLDSIGSHRIRIYTFSSGAYADTIMGEWLHDVSTKSVRDRIGGFGVKDRGSVDSTLHVFIEQLKERIGKFGVNDRAVSLDSALSVYVQQLGEQGASVPDSLVARVDSSLVILQAGNGPYLCSLYIYNTSGAITSGNVRMVQGATEWVDAIDSLGWTVFGLASGTWYGTVYASPYVQDTIPQTFSISADLTDSITMSSITISPSSNPDMAVVYIGTYDIHSDTIEGAKLEITVNGQPPFTDADSNLVFIPHKIESYSDSNGIVRDTIRTTDGVTDARGDDITYSFRFSKPGYFRAEWTGRAVTDSVWRIQ